MKAFRFPNGMVIVIGNDGEQRPELQGRWEDVEDRLRRYDVEVERMTWEEFQQLADPDYHPADDGYPPDES